MKTKNFDVYRYPIDKIKVKKNGVIEVHGTNVIECYADLEAMEKSIQRRVSEYLSITKLDLVNFSNINLNTPKNKRLK